MSDKKKKDLTIKTGSMVEGIKMPSANTSAVGISGPGAKSPTSAAVPSAKTDYGMEAESDKKIADDAEKIAKKGSKIGLDVRGLLKASRKVKQNADKKK